MFSSSSSSSIAHPRYFHHRLLHICQLRPRQRDLTPATMPPVAGAFPASVMDFSSVRGHAAQIYQFFQTRHDWRFGTTPPPRSLQWMLKGVKPGVRVDDGFVRNMRVSHSSFFVSDRTTHYRMARFDDWPHRGGRICRDCRRGDMKRIRTTPASPFLERPVEVVVPPLLPKTILRKYYFITA